jgi:hypothetical protein
MELVFRLPPPLREELLPRQEFSFQSGRPFRRSLSGKLTVRTVSPGGRFRHRESSSVRGLLPFRRWSLSDFLSAGRGFSRDFFLIREVDRGDCSRRIKLPSAISIPSEVTPVGIPVREKGLSESCPPGKLILRLGKVPLQEILRPGTGTCRGEKSGRNRFLDELVSRLGTGPFREVSVRSFGSVGRV